MKIVHICLSGIYSDGFSYQENLLAKYHKKMGLDVDVISNCWEYDKNGKIVKSNFNEFYDQNGIHIIRLNVKKNRPFSSKFKTFYNLYETIERLNPDILFVHGINFLDIKTIRKYMVDHSNVKLYMDNHCDYSNSATNFISKYFLHRVIWRHYAKKIEPYVIKFYGVLPSRVDFIIENYALSKNKCELLLMGADDELVQECINSDEIRKKYKIEKDDFLIVTGGKIDLAKRQTLLLMEAVKKIDNPKVKLIIFGSIVPELKDQLESLCIENKIIYAGWIESKESYKYFSSADLVIFPGRHSVFWEQVVAQGIPMVCKSWEGTRHIDIGNNVKFLYNDTVEELENCIKLLCKRDKIYNEMKKSAESDKRRKFLYSEISKKV